MSNSSFHTYSIFQYFSYCFSLPSTKKHFFAYIFVNVPFLPLCLYILVLGAQQWRSRSRISHTDVFTYNMVVVQLLGIAGSVVLTVNVMIRSELVVTIGVYVILLTYCATVIFQILTCLERYLAVVHPVTYLSLKSQTWTRARNFSCGFIWLWCIVTSVWSGQLEVFEVFFGLTLLFLSLSFLIVLFCNLCVLRALMRPRPGDGAKGNKAKQRALCTITAITATLLVKLCGDAFSTLTFLLFAKYPSAVVSYDESCAMFFSIIWFTLPSSLVLPLLFLHRNVKPSRRKTNT